MGSTAVPFLTCQILESAIGDHLLTITLSWFKREIFLKEDGNIPGMEEWKDHPLPPNYYEFEITGLPRKDIEKRITVIY